MNNTNLFYSSRPQKHIRISDVIGNIKSIKLDQVDIVITDPPKSIESCYLEEKDDNVSVQYIFTNCR